MLAVDRLGQHQQLLLGQRADQRIAGAGLDPVEHAQVALALVAEGGVGGRVRLAQVDGDAQALRVLVHQLRALARAVGQQPAADQLETLLAQVEQLHRHVDAPRQPARQVFFLRLDLHRMARLGHIHAVRVGGALHPGRRRGGQRRHRRARRRPLAPEQRTDHAAGEQQPRRGGRPPPGARQRAAPQHQRAQRPGHRLVEQGGEPRAHGVAVGGPLAHARGVLRVLAQPGFDLLARFGRAVEFTVDPGAEPFVVEGLRIHRHTTRRSAVPAGLPWPSSSPRKVARARHTRDITVPTGMCITSATSA